MMFFKRFSLFIICLLMINAPVKASSSDDLSGSTADEELVSFPMRYFPSKKHAKEAEQIPEVKLSYLQLQELKHHFYWFLENKRVATPRSQLIFRFNVVRKLHRSGYFCGLREMPRFPSSEYKAKFMNERGIDLRLEQKILCAEFIKYLFDVLENEVETTTGSDSTSSSSTTIDVDLDSATSALYPFLTYRSQRKPHFQKIMPASFSDTPGTSTSEHMTAESSDDEVDISPHRVMYPSKSMPNLTELKLKNMQHMPRTATTLQGSVSTSALQRKPIIPALNLQPLLDKRGPWNPKTLPQSPLSQNQSYDTYSTSTEDSPGTSELKYIIKIRAHERSGQAKPRTFDFIQAKRQIERLVTTLDLGNLDLLHIIAEYEEDQKSLKLEFKTASGPQTPKMRSIIDYFPPILEFPKIDN